MTELSNVLIVDDVPANRDILSELLEHSDYRIFEASSGPEALRLAAETPPDLILLDVMMPGMDGHEVCRLVRASERLAEVPVIMLTAMDDHETRIKGIEAGADDFISKPFNRAEMRARVRTITRLNRYRRLHEASETSRQNAERLRLVMDTALDAVITTDPEDVVLTWNRQAEAVFGWTPEEAVGRKLLELVVPPREQETQKRAGQSYRAAAGLSPRPSQREEITAQRKNGEEFPVEFSVTPAKVGNALSFTAFARDITERKASEKALRQSLQEKEALLKEVHHRVKNNLQVITSLLRLEAGRSTDEGARAVLKVMQGRVMSMSTLHDLLCQSGVFATVDLGAYLKKLASQSFQAFKTSPASIQLATDLASVSTGMDQALPCGLIVNELISNSFKHGFPKGREGEVRVELQYVGGPQIRLSVSDTGVGLPTDFEATRGRSLGLQLVSDLARQLGGALSIEPGLGSGARFGLTISGVPTGVQPVSAHGANGSDARGNHEDSHR